jgi:hypothetical protein
VRNSAAAVHSCAIPKACLPRRVSGPTAPGRNRLSCQINRTKNSIGRPLARAADSTSRQIISARLSTRYLADRWSAFGSFEFWRCRKHKECMRTNHRYPSARGLGPSRSNQSFVKEQPAAASKKSIPTSGLILTSRFFVRRPLMVRIKADRNGVKVPLCEN